MTEEKLSIQDTLIKLGACEDAREWAKGKTWPEIFETCHRGDWLLWLFKKVNPYSLKEITRAKAHCALTVRHLMKYQRSLDACDAALKFADGLITIEELNKAAYDAAAAASAVASYAADAAAAAAAYAAAADASYAAADAAAYAADSLTKNQKLTADICREYLPIEIWNI